MAETAFITSNTFIDHKNKRIGVSKIFYWFKADFGGKKGIKFILNSVYNHSFNGYKIVFKPYDWSPDLHNFTNF